MKTREEQIEKMAKIMCGCDCGPCGRDCRCASYKWAKKLYAAGYRKQSDTVREFVEKLNNVLTEFLHQDREDSCQYYLMNYDVLQDRISALAEEYSAEVEE